MVFELKLGMVDQLRDGISEGSRGFHLIKSAKPRARRDDAYSLGRYAHSARLVRMDGIEFDLDEVPDHLPGLPHNLTVPKVGACAYLNQLKSPATSQ